MGAMPTLVPTLVPTTVPTLVPTTVPTTVPSTIPTELTNVPTGVTTNEPVVPTVPASEQDRPRTPEDFAAMSKPSLCLKLTAIYPSWTFLILPKGISDCVAIKRSADGSAVQRWMFCQIGHTTDRRFAGEYRAAFIQNAFSNNATPVYIITEPTRVRFENANTGERVRL